MKSDLNNEIKRFKDQGWSEKKIKRHYRAVFDEGKISEQELRGVRKILREEFSANRRIKALLISALVCLLLIGGGIGAYFGFKFFADYSLTVLSDASFLIEDEDGQKADEELTLYKPYTISFSFKLTNPSNASDNPVLSFKFTSGKVDDNGTFEGVKFEDFSLDETANLKISMEPSSSKICNYKIGFYPTSLTDSFRFRVSLANGSGADSIVRHVNGGNN